MTDTNHHDLLVELGCEELPPLALEGITRAFFEGVREGLSEAGIAFDIGRSRPVYTPRRMSLLLADVADRQPDRVLERKGPAVSAAFDDQGQPTRAATGFAGSVGLPVEKLERFSTDKGEWLFARVEEAGKPLREVLYPILEQALDQLPVPRPMRWSDHDFSFVRPAHWLVVLHGTEVLEGRLLGCTADRLTRGHRIHAPGTHALATASGYVERLRDCFVMADPAMRRDAIREQAERLGAEVGGRTRITDALLDEVTNIVEWPVAVRCAFDAGFLGVPGEALVASMESHQKFFPILDSHGELTADFVVVANIESRDVAAMSAGYERVIRPRLADAQFFWMQDLKQDPEAWSDALDKVVFQKDIGSVGDKSRRIADLAARIAELVGSNSGTAHRAGRVCKLDLVSHMVGEFPELQGIMNGYYLQHAGESEDVAAAAAEHYHPRFAGDTIPATTNGQLVALADRLDTLVGIFAAGLKPTGNKDPFALRRAALGVVRILEEAPFTVSIDTLLALAAEGLKDQLAANDDTVTDVRGFILERLRHHLLDGGASTRQVNAVLAAPLAGLPDLRARLEAVSGFMRREEADSLVAANKRIGNILKKQDGGFSEHIDAKLFAFDEERQLYTKVNEAKSAVAPLFAQGDYSAALAVLAGLRQPVDRYFDSVMVMDDDPSVRANRLAQLHVLKGLFDHVAEFSLAD